MHKKAQTAVEFLTTYGWVLMLILILIILLASSNVFNINQWLPMQCMLSSGFQCSSYKLQNTSTGAQLVIHTSNGMGYDILFSGDAAALTADNLGAPGRNTYYGNCYPLNKPVRPGDEVTCIVNVSGQNIPPLGKNIQMTVSINYKNCNSAPSYTQTGDCSQASNYTVSGSVRTPVEPFANNLFCGDGICSPSIGENALNCQIDCAAPFMNLNIRPTSVAANGVDTAQVIVYLTDPSGAPVSGVDVNFTTDLGNFTATGTNSTINTTNSSGMTLALLKSKYPTYANGTANVNASALVHSSVQFSNITTVNFTNYPAYLNLALSPQIVLLGGSNTSVLTAQLLNENGDPEDPPQITFSSNSSTVTLNPSQNTTNELGIATSLASSLVAQVAQINITYKTLLNTSILTFASIPPGCNPPAASDWLITSKILCKDVTIVLNGSLNVTDMGDLTFKNVTLKINVTNPNGIFVQGGNFTILDDDNNPATTNDASNITNNTPTTSGYLFNVDPGSTFTMKNSELHYSSVLSITANNTIIQNSIISGNSYTGIELDYSNNSNIINNTILNNQVGISLLDFSTNNSIINNTVTSCSYMGLDVEDSNNNTFANNVMDLNGEYGIYLYDSSNNTFTNTISNSSKGGGMHIGDGIHLTFNSKNNIFNNVIINSNHHYGMYFDTSSSGNIINNMTENSNSNFGIFLASASSNNVFTNVNFTNTSGIFLFSPDVSYNNFTNMTINPPPFTGLGIWANGPYNNFTNITVHSNASNTVVSLNGAFNSIQNSTISNDGGECLSSSSTNSYIANNNVSKCNGIGIHLYSSSNNIISNNTITNNIGDGIFLGSSNNNNITNNNVSNNIGNGIYIASSSNTLISNNNITLNDNASIYLDSGADSSTITNNIITYNGGNIYDYHAPDLSNYRGGIECHSNNNTLANNTIMFNRHGIILTNSNNNTLANNTVSNNSAIFTSIGISLYSSNNNNITNNNVSGNAYYGIYLYSSSDNINNNIVTYNNWGILLYNSNNNNITNNNASYNNYESGIKLDGNNNNVINNTANNNNNGAGIDLGGSYNLIFKNNASFNSAGISIGGSYNIIANNTASNNAQGIGLYGVAPEGTSHIYIANNTVISNGGYGMYVLLGTDTTNSITSNNISSNQYGIYTREGDFGVTGVVTISQNNIQSNTLRGVYCGDTPVTPTFSGNTIINNGDNCDACVGCPG